MQQALAREVGDVLPPSPQEAPVLDTPDRAADVPIDACHAGAAPGVSVVTPATRERDR